ncbi:hypothetical protein POTOM_012977 [Populus tomentosa]|uniref:Uncharacterized protein n=1 Tax=Populus tomentosa TaxID=118781 RepID=A0A8X8A969_POPTO|nr:hypothetical protein POTOM_012977 [Populus tomentosa]
MYLYMVVGHSNFFCKIEDTSINKSTEGQNEETTQLGCFISSFLSSKGILAITLSDALGARHLQEECALKILQIQPSSFYSLHTAFHTHPLENDLHLLQKRSSPG